MWILPFLCDERNGKLQTKQTCICKFSSKSLIERYVTQIIITIMNHPIRGTCFYTIMSCELWNIFDCVILSCDYALELHFL